MNISKKLLYLLLIIFSFNLNFFNSIAEEKVNLNEEELPAIDPFQGTSASMTTSQNKSMNFSEAVEKLRWDGGCQNSNSCNEYFNVTGLKCANGYGGGQPIVTRCSSWGQEYEISGCFKKTR